MRNIGSLFIIAFLLTGCATSAVNRFPAGSNVQVTEWQILHGADGAKTLRGTVSNYSPYLVYDLFLITQIKEENEIIQELKTELKPLFPETQTQFEIMLPAGLQEPQPIFEYQFQYTPEEEFWEYRYDKQFHAGPFQVSPMAGAWWHRNAGEETFDSRQNK